MQSANETHSGLWEVLSEWWGGATLCYGLSLTCRTESSLSPRGQGCEVFRFCCSQSSGQEIVREGDGEKGGRNAQLGSWVMGGGALTGFWIEGKGINFWSKPQQAGLCDLLPWKSWVLPLLQTQPSSHPSSVAIPWMTWMVAFWVGAGEGNKQYRKRGAWAEVLEMNLNLCKLFEPCIWRPDTKGIFFFFKSVEWKLCLSVGKFAKNPQTLLTVNFWVWGGSLHTYICILQMVKYSL